MHDVTLFIKTKIYSKLFYTSFHQRNLLSVLENVDVVMCYFEAIKLKKLCDVNTYILNREAHSLKEHNRFFFIRINIIVLNTFNSRDVSNFWFSLVQYTNNIFFNMLLLSGDKLNKLHFLINKENPAGSAGEGRQNEGNI